MPFLLLALAATQGSKFAEPTFADFEREMRRPLPPERAARLRSAANTQAAAVAEHVVGQNFMATHWLVSYALGAELAR